MKIIWTEEYELGIPVIDAQHQRIAHYINQIYDSRGAETPAEVTDVLRSLVDYTFSHFAFEEAMLEEVGYETLPSHQKIHHAFADKIKTLQTRFEQGEDVAEELAAFLQKWLINHILSEDAAYCETVKVSLLNMEASVKKNWFQKATERFFS